MKFIWIPEHRPIQLDKVINVLSPNRIHHRVQNDVYVHFLIFGLSSKFHHFPFHPSNDLFDSYLSSYIDDVNSTCLQSEIFSPVHTPYSNTRWSLKLYPRGLNEKQQTNNNIAIFLKYASGSMPMIKAKAEFSVVNRNNELVMLRSTNFHTFSLGNDWGYSEFLDGNYLNSRRNDLLTDDRLRVYVRVILVDEKESLLADLSQPQHVNTAAKNQASASSSFASSSSATSITLPNATTTSTIVPLGLFSDERERFKSIELLTSQIKSLLDDQRFTDVNIHVIPKQEHSLDDQRKSPRMKRTSDSHEQSSSGID